MQSRDLTGPAALYSGPSGVLLRYSYSPQDSGKLFAIEPAGFTLTQWIPRIWGSSITSLR